MKFISSLVAVLFFFLIGLGQAGAAEFEIMEEGTLQQALEDAKGSVVLVSFWATWCQPCLVEMPELVRLRKDYSDSDLTVIGISIDSDARRLEAFLRQNPLNFDIYLAPRSVQGSFGVSAIPTIFFYNRQGDRVWTQKGLMRSQQLHDMVEALVEQ